MWPRHVSPVAFSAALICFGGPFTGQGADRVIESQSGLQMTYGGVSTTINRRPAMASQADDRERHTGNRTQAVPAMIVYGLCVVAGLAASAPFRDERRRLLCATVASAIAVMVLVVLVALLVWPGSLRPLPRHGIAMSGYVDYMISDEHLAAVKHGMSLEEVGVVLNIAQRRLEPPDWSRRSPFSRLRRISSPSRFRPLREPNATAACSQHAQTRSCGCLARRSSRAVGV